MIIGDHLASFDRNVFDKKNTHTHTNKRNEFAWDRSQRSANYEREIHTSRTEVIEKKIYDIYQCRKRWRLGGYSSISAPSELKRYYCDGRGDVYVVYGRLTRTKNPPEANRRN